MDQTLEEMRARLMSNLRTLHSAWAPLALAAVIGIPSRADFTPIAQPNAGYLASPSLLPITAVDFDVMSDVTNGIDTIMFDIPMAALTVPAIWSSWGSPPNTE